MKVPARKSITTKLIFVVLGLYSLVALLVTSSHVILEYRYQKANIRQDLTNIQEAFEGAIENSLWKMDQQSLETVVLGVLRTPLVTGVKVSNANGRLTAIGGTIKMGENVENLEIQVDLLGLEPKRGTPLSDVLGSILFEHTFTLEKQNSNNDFKLGDITIYSSNSIIYRRIKLELILLGINVLVTFTTFLLGLQWAVKRYLGRPLDELAEATGDISLETLGSFSVSIDAPEGCELKVFERSFNTMVRNLDNAISMRQQTEIELSKSEQRFNLAMRATRDGLWDWNLVTNEIYFSPGWKYMLGYEDNELPNEFSVWEKLTHPEDVKRSREMQQELISKKRDRFQIEFRMKHKNGHWVDIFSRADAVFNSEGEAVRLVGTHVDITERKRNEKEREKLQNQLRQAQKMESVGRLAGGVAHDFNNMLSVILGNTEIIMEDLDKNQPFYPNLLEIEKAANRSVEITRQLLAFARKQTILPKVLDLNETVNSMLKMIQRLIGEDINLVWLPAKTPCLVLMDPTQIDQILANLCVNAKDAIAGVGKITIETCKVRFNEEYCADHSGFVPGDFISLVVSDNGCGMEKEILDNLFEPFYTTKSVDKGTGLGLATVYGIIKQNNGFINVYSEPNEGSSFKIYLPFYDGISVQDNNKNAMVPDLRGSETILLVEDELSILNMAAQILDRLGYTVLTANKPGEAIRIVREQKGNIHLLITDVIMPEMNGRELSMNLLATNPNMKCLFMSGYTANVIVHHGVLEDGVNFIQKPFSKKELSKMVREVLEGGKV